MSNVNDVRPKDVTVNVSDVSVVTINKGGKERHLRFDLNAFAYLEEKYGSIDAVMEKIDKGSILALRDLLWAGLRHEDDQLTLEDVGAMFDLRNLEEVSKQIYEAMGAAMPNKKDGVVPRKHA